MNNIKNVGYSASLYHHGIKGQKWGVRRYQNEDGTLTATGRDRYGARVLRGHAGLGGYSTKKRQLAGDKRDLEYLNNGGHLSYGITKKRQAAFDERDRKALEKRIAKNESELSEPKKGLSDKQKKVLKGVAITAGVAVAAYGTYKVAKVVKNKKAITAGEDFARKVSQNEYIMRNIANTQSHIDPTSSIRKSEKYQHAFRGTLNSRNTSISGDRKLYGAKSVEGRNAAKEAKNFVDNAKAYQAHRGGMYGYGYKGDIESNLKKTTKELDDLTKKLLKQNSYLLR